MRVSAKYPFFLFLLVFTFSNAFAQNQGRTIDSLNALLQNATQDTARLRLYLALGNACDLKDNLKYAEPAIQLAEKLLAQAKNEKEKEMLLKQKAHAYDFFTAFYHNGISLSKEMEYYQKQLAVYQEAHDSMNMARTLLGIIDNYKGQGDDYKAMEECQTGLLLTQKMNYKKGIARFLRQLGDIYDDQGDSTQAMENYQKALSIVSDLKDERAIAYAFITIAKGYIHNIQKALINYNKALQLLEEQKDTASIRKVYKLIGEMYMENKDFPNALENYQKSLSLAGKNWFDWELADLLNNIGIIYFNQGNITSALDYHYKALKVSEQLNDVPRVAITNFRLAQAYLKQKDFVNAKNYSDRALILTTKNTFANTILDIELSAAEIDSAIGDYKDAFANYRHYTALSNKVKSEEVRKAALKEKFQDEYNRQKELDQVAQKQKDAIEQADKRKQKIITWSVVGGLLVVLVFAGFILQSLRVTRKQKQIIEIKNKETEEQKKIIEDRNKDMLASITYAKRLQDAILPPISLIQKYLPESFVLYKSKDIVAGDFYWMERAGDNMLIAAADCTGHGVPGALVSVVCSNALNRTVKEFHITEPGKILDMVRKLVLETFENSENNVQDGMDISLCGINIKTKEVQWSGAYNSLWYIHNGEIHEIPADKQPIGKHNKPQPFNTYNLNLQKGDTLYLFTDGYADQFGGPKGKKFKYKQMEELLLANTTKSMDEQKSALENTLESWKGDLEQVDDILVIGIRI
jgi:tetratricopeptide (TPR) repeat protein